jgi:hypothetical protein
VSSSWFEHLIIYNGSSSPFCIPTVKVGCIECQPHLVFEDAIYFVTAAFEIVSRYKLLVSLYYRPSCAHVGP